MFEFFKKRKDNLITNMEWLGVDIHSHLLPGLDDGAKDLKESVEYIKKLEELGFRKLICTPHIFTELYPNTPEIIIPVLANLRNVLQTEGIKLEIDAGAEYMIDEQFVLTDTLFCLKDNYILVEMSYMNETPNIDEVIFNLQLKGYQPVLAHPERYIFYFNAIDRLERFKEMGCLLQLNLLSVLGYYGKEVKKLATSLLKKELYDLAGTDLHHQRHLNVLNEGVKSGKLYKEIGSYPFKNRELFL